MSGGVTIITLVGGLNAVDRDGCPMRAEAGRQVWHRRPGEPFPDFQARVVAEVEGDFVVFDGAGLAEVER